MASRFPPFITPAKRQELQTAYAFAQKLLRGEEKHASPVEAALQQMANCVGTDPENLAYLDLFLAALSKHRVGWLTKMSDFFRAKQPEVCDLRERFAATLAALQKSPADATLLAEAASICGQCELSTTQLRWLAYARKVHPSHVGLLEDEATALADSGEFARSLAAWRQLAERIPSEKQAAVQTVCDALSQYLLEEASTTAAEAAAVSQEQLLNRDWVQTEVAAAISSWNLASAERLLKAAISVSGGDLPLRDSQEQLSAATLRRQVLLADAWAKLTKSSRAKSLLSAMKREAARVELDLCKLRSERFPGDAQARFELAKALRACGNFSEALQVLDECAALPLSESQHAAALSEQARNWQQLLQFDRALPLYVQAIQAYRALDAAAANSSSYYSQTLADAKRLAAAMQRADTIEELGS